MKARVGTIACIAILVALAVTPAIAMAQDATATTPASTPSATFQLTKAEQTLFDLVNKQRTKHGLAKLRVGTRLTNAARAHSREMGEAQYFAHDSASGETFARRLIRFGYVRTGYRFWKAGEDIYYGSGLYSSPVCVIDAWMKSPAHRAVILTQCFRDIGVGVYVAQQGYRGITCPVTFFTIDLGRRIRL
jgi:uncharacterized protein YkwD